jgi:opacity protein-like surface antigen
MTPRAHLTPIMRLTLILALCVCGLAAAPCVARAQSDSATPTVATATAPAAVTPSAPAASRGRTGEGRLEIAGSVGYAGGHDLGSERATETGNGVPSGSPVTLFETDSSMERGAQFEGRVSWRLTHAFAVEGTFAMTRTHLRSAVRNDSEQAAPTVATSPLTQYTAEGGLVWHLDGLRFGHGRARPFITGGGGYLRQLHDKATLVETGQSAFAGGGLKFRLHEAARRSLLQAIGLRADVRLNVTHGGFDVDASAWRKYSSASGGLFVCF